MFDAIMFDLDGVVTRTAELHAAAWRDLFDAYLLRRAAPRESFRPFDLAEDYRLYLDGRPRHDGVRVFLASRGVTLPEGSQGDAPDRETVNGLAAWKDRLFRERLAREGVALFADSVPFLRRARDAGMRTAIVSSSRNAAAVIAAAGLAGQFDVRVDGNDAAALKLKGKPAPDTFLHAASKLGVVPARAIGLEDALAGVEAIRAAGYGLVVGVDRSGHGDDLRRHGADVVVQDLSSLKFAPAAARRRRPKPAGPATRAMLAVLPTPDPDWLIVEDGFTLTREHELESIFAIANGRLGSRASLAEGGTMSSPATFLAGLFDEEPGPTPALAVLPDWSALTITVEGAPLRLSEGRMLSQRRVLDLFQGVLWRDWRHEDPAGRITRLSELRLASLADRALLFQSLAFTPENYSGVVRLTAGMGELGIRRTSAGVTAALAARARLTAGNDSADPPEPAGAELTQDAELGKTLRIDRIVAVAGSRKAETAQAQASRRARQAAARGAPRLIADHCGAWADRWRASDLRVTGDPAAQRALRFAAYHLLSAANPEDERVSIGARALTGRAYNGHIFWDTEIFMLPFFVLTWPEAARALVMYRFHTLAAARAKAARHGASGAFYAWESADTGEDVTPSFVIAPDGVVAPIRLAAQEQHISADVAYAAWTYWWATGDDGFLLEAGAEILVETARFWASRSEPGDDGLRHIRGVVGPDEYHETVDDDAYTNGMARWNLQTATRVAGLVAERWPERWRDLSTRLGLEADEVADWARTAGELYTGLDHRTGLIEQFDGYFGLEDIELSAFEPRNAPIDVLLGRERIQASQLIKQPDVLMLLHLLWDSFPPEVRIANFRYYAPRCAHGSSLSPAIHALVAARLGEDELAQRYFRQASDIDLADNMGNAAGGVHAAALGGLWQAAVFGFAGLSLREAGPQLHPNLPRGWREIAFRIRWRGQAHELEAVSAPPEVAQAHAP